VAGRLDTSPRFSRPDDVYEMLVGATRGLDDSQARLVQAKLILLLANHIGDPEVLAEAIAVAREDVAAGSGDAGMGAQT
jgi:hypothetical protein